MSDRPALHAMTIEEVKRYGVSPLAVLDARIAEAESRIDIPVPSAYFPTQVAFWHAETARWRARADAYTFARDLLVLGSTISEEANR